jgi:phosphoribosylamine--glycine ligase
VIHAGTRRRDDGAIVSSGGRVLSVTASGSTLAEARAVAYERVTGVTLPGGQYRRDIALSAVRTADGDS